MLKNKLQNLAIFILLPLSLVTLSVHAKKVLPFIPIDQGILAPSNSFPAIVRIENYNNFSSDGFDLFQCTGTLLSPSVILTAAHCMNQDNKGLQTVILPNNESSQTPEQIIVTGKSYIPSQYTIASEAIDQIELALKLTTNTEQRSELNKKLFEAQYLLMKNDLAIIELTSTASIQPEVIPQLSCENLPFETEVEVAGFGMNIQPQKPSATISNPNEPLKDINTNYELFYGFNKTSLTVAGLYKISATDGAIGNHGDSGSPLMKKNDNLKIFGVASSTIYNKANDLQGTATIYAATSSNYAYEFYQSLKDSSYVSAEIKKVLPQCHN